MLSDKSLFIVLLTLLFVQFTKDIYTVAIKSLFMFIYIYKLFLNIYKRKSKKMIKINFNPWYQFNLCSGKLKSLYWKINLPV